MKLRSGTSTEWLDRINTIDIQGLHHWCVEVFLTCPGLSASYPDAFAHNRVLPGHEGDGSRDDYIQDGKPMQDWIDNPRVCYLKDGEGPLYEEFNEWYMNVLWDDYLVLGDWHYTSNSYYALLRRDAMMAIKPAMRLRSLLADEQLIRFLNEVILSRRVRYVSGSDQYNSSEGNGRITTRSQFIWRTVWMT